MLKFKLYVTTF